MLNEILQWVVLVAIAFLVIAMYWNYGMAVQRSRGGLVDTSGPRIGDRLPADLLRLLPHTSDEGVVAFVSENCRTCSRLLARADRGEGGPRPNLVLVAANPSPGFVEALQILDFPVYVDDGSLWRKLEIVATPFLVYVDETGRVTAKDVNHVIESGAEGSAHDGGSTSI